MFGLFAVRVLGDVRIHGPLAEIFIVFVRLHVLGCRRRYDGAVVPLGIGSLGFGDEALIMPTCFGILLDRGGPDRAGAAPHR